MKNSSKLLLAGGAALAGYFLFVRPAQKTLGDFTEGISSAVANPFGTAANTAAGIVSGATGTIIAPIEYIIKSTTDGANYVGQALADVSKNFFSQPNTKAIADVAYNTAKLTANSLFVGAAPVNTLIDYFYNSSMKGVATPSMSSAAANTIFAGGTNISGSAKASNFGNTSSMSVGTANTIFAGGTNISGNAKADNFGSITATKAAASYSSVASSSPYWGSPAGVATVAGFSTTTTAAPIKAFVPPTATPVIYSNPYGSYTSTPSGIITYINQPLTGTTHR